MLWEAGGCPTTTDTRASGTPETGGGRLGQRLEDSGLVEHSPGELRVHPEGEGSVLPHPRHLGGVVKIGEDRGGHLSTQPGHEGGPEGGVFRRRLRSGRGRRRRGALRLRGCPGGFLLRLRGQGGTLLFPGRGVRHRDGLGRGSRRGWCGLGRDGGWNGRASGQLFLQPGDPGRPAGKGIVQTLIAEADPGTAPRRCGGWCSGPDQGGRFGGASASGGAGGR